MSVKYKLVQKMNPKTETKQWYASSNTSRARAKEGDKTSKNSSVGSTISDIETQATLRQVGKYIPEALLSGESVRIPGFGSFRVAFHSKGVDDIRTFRARTMISGARVVFTPDPEFRTALKSGISFENSGVKEGKMDYATLNSYLRAKGLITDDEPAVNPDAGGSQGGETPGGGTTPDPNQGGGSNNGGDGIE